MDDGLAATTHAGGGGVRTHLADAIVFLDQQVVPDLRRRGFAAVRVAADELHRLAAALDAVASPPSRHP